MPIRIIFASLIMLSVRAELTAQQQASSYPGQASTIGERFDRLEREIRLLRTEAEQLGRRPIRLPRVKATDISEQGISPRETETFDFEELRGEMKKAFWKKGDFSVFPYGCLWGNTAYSTQRTRNGSYTLYVYSGSKGNEGEFIVDARTTRLGLEVDGPRFGFLDDSKSGGRVEVDFQQSVLTTENRALIVLRQAYWEVKNDEYRLLAGQTWDIVSPLRPGVLNAGACWDAGNIGYRRAQLRGERYWTFSDKSLATAELSLNVPVFESEQGFSYGVASNWPILEGRVAWTLAERDESGRPITIGLSGHIGEEQFNHIIAGNNRRRTWSGNIDLNVPLTDRLGVQGELFVGENLGAFLGNIGQGINPLTLNPIRGAGGWIEVWYEWTSALHSHVGYSIDDPLDADLALGQRTYNQCYFGNIEFFALENFLIGIEASSWKTLYADLLPGDAVRIEFVARYGF